MLVTLNGHINIKDARIEPNIIDCEVKSSWDSFTDTAKVKLPLLLNKIYTREYFTGEKPLFKIGDEASITLGYDNEVLKRFEGYVTEVSSNAPIEVTLQDQMYLLKKIQCSYAKKGKSTLKELCDKILKGKVKYKVVADYELGAYSTQKGNASIASVLSWLKEKYFVKSFFRDGILYIGAAIVPEIQRSIDLAYVLEHSLTYKKKEDIQLQLKGIIHKHSGKNKEVTVGVEGGAVRTFQYGDISEEACKKMLATEMERLRYDGYRGSITIPLNPKVNHGDFVKFPDVWGVEGAEHYYLVKSVTTTANAQGGRQVLELESKKQ